jgi:hypothetical protein
MCVFINIMKQSPIVHPVDDRCLSWRCFTVIQTARQCEDLPCHANDKADQPQKWGIVLKGVIALMDTEEDGLL